MPSTSVSMQIKNKQAVLEQVQTYKDNISVKVSQFLSALASYGISVINPIIAEYKADVKSQINLTPSVGKPRASKVKRIGKNYYRIEIRLSGQNVLFMEFSTGIRLGTPPGGFPSAVNNTAYGDGYGYGTYNPASDNAYRVKGWAFEKNGHWRHTYGTKAYMPMFKADWAMYRRIQTTARSIFMS